jgi:hypothetical protein
MGRNLVGSYRQATNFQSSVSLVVFVVFRTTATPLITGFSKKKWRAQ